MDTESNPFWEKVEIARFLGAGKITPDSTLDTGTLVTMDDMDSNSSSVFGHSIVSPNTLNPTLEPNTPNQPPSTHPHNQRNLSFPIPFPKATLQLKDRPPFSTLSRFLECLWLEP